MKTMITAVLVVVMALLPIQINAEEPPPPPKDVWLAACVVVAVGAAMTAIYLVSKKCQPKYYWLMDDEKPPNFWVGTATRKECQIQGWHRIGGPYNRPQDAPTVHPASTNRVQELAPVPVNIKVLASTNGVNWTVVDQQTCDLDDFAYFPTNSVGGMFRFEIAQP